MADDKLDRVFAAWELAELLDDHEPASEDDILVAETALGHRLPAQLRRLYGVTSGDALDIELVIRPLLPDPGVEDSLALTTSSDLMRQWMWQVPQPMLVFGDNNGEESYGLWLDPEDPARQPLVVEIGESGEPACLAVIAQDLASFLLERTFYEFSYDEDQGGAAWALEPLGAPDDLSDFDPETATDEDLARLATWANPALPADLNRHSFQARLTGEQVQALSASIGR